MAEVKKTTANRNRTTSEIDLYSDLKSDVPDDLKEEISKEVAEYVKEQILLTVAEARSPVEGESFPRLSKSYAAYKESQSLPGKPNLEFTGRMLNALDYKVTDDGFEIGIFGSEAEKAEGHNNFNGDSELPQRRFIPDTGQDFKSGIRSGINKIIQDKVAEGTRFRRFELAQITDAGELWDFLREEFDGFRKSEIIGVISRSPDLAMQLSEFNLLRFLDGEG